jgi:hypothetical protein
MDVPYRSKLQFPFALLARANSVKVAALSNEEVADMGAGSRRLVMVIVISALATTAQTAADNQTWRFAVSGDSRNCGDVIMRGIQQGVQRDQATFYWHLGDLRAIFEVDEDLQRMVEVNKPAHFYISDYENAAWDDFIKNQIDPFGDLPFYLGIGNHELIPPKNRDQFIEQFADWLDQPSLRAQRLADNPADHVLRTYNHWKKGAIDFISLDNASLDQFDDTQLKWFKGVIDRDAADPAIRTVVVGMHKALPFSISCDHSMNESGEGERSGLVVYHRLLDLHNLSQKHVYILASHSHLFMDGTFNTNYWLNNGGVLPGWIIGTAGAQHYRLPKNSIDANASAEGVYGYLLATVHPDSTIDFVFKEVKERDIPEDIRKIYSDGWVHKACFEDNEKKDIPEEKGYCAAVAAPVHLQPAH